MTYQSQNLVHALIIMDGNSEEVVDVVQFSTFDLAAFSHQFDVPVQYDPDMLDRYAVGPDDISFLSAYLERPILFDFTTYGYWVEAMTP
jgi:hypothetical protein